MITTRTQNLLAAAVALAMAAAGIALAQQRPPASGPEAGPGQVGEMGLTPEAGKKFFKAPGYSPYAGRSFPTKPLWGDTHLHTSNSLDARAFGVTLGPEEAFRSAPGAPA